MLLAVTLNYLYGANPDRKPYNPFPGQSPSANCDNQQWHCRITVRELTPGLLFKATSTLPVHKRKHHLVLWPLWPEASASLLIVCAYSCDLCIASDCLRGCCQLWCAVQNTQIALVASLVFLAYLYFIMYWIFIRRATSKLALESYAKYK